MRVGVVRQGMGTPGLGDGSPPIRIPKEFLHQLDRMGGAAIPRTMHPTEGHSLDPIHERPQIESAAPHDLPHPV